MSSHKLPSQIPLSVPPKKLHYISNLRTSLTALVIFHHTATSYGGEGRGVYQSSFHSQSSSFALVGFNAFNQSFFMGTYMYLARHFSRKALQRKSKRAFLKDRVWRLGVPTVAYTVVGAPFCFAVLRYWKGEKVDFKFLREFWKGLKGPRGPVWFTATLLMFDGVFAGYDWLTGSLRLDKKESEKAEAEEKISSTKLFSTLGLTSAAEVLIRNIWPVSTIFPPLKLNIGYVGQYIAAYIFGANSEDVDNAIPSTRASAGLLGLSLGTTFAFAHLLRAKATARQHVKGGLNMLAACYAIWGNVTGYFVGSSLLTVYRKHLDTSWGWVNEAAFPAFLLHMPVLTIIGTATDKWQAGPVKKTAVVGSATVLASWAAGMGLMVFGLLS